MPTIQINRGYSLTVGDWKTGDGWKVDTLQVSFEISKSSNNKDSTNSASIEVTNLSPEQIKILETDYLAAEFYAGYYSTSNSSSNINRIFAGQVTSVTTRKNGTDIVTQLQMGSGYVELNYNVLSKLVSPGKTVKDVFEEIRGSMPGVARGVYNGTNINNQLISGYPLMGEPRRIMDKLSSTYQVEYRVDDNVLYVNDIVGGINEADNSALVINQESGLVDIPYLVQGDKKRSSADPITKPVTQFRMLLNPDIMPGEIIRLEYPGFTGWYKVDSLRHSGSYRSNDWYTEVRCSENVKA
tara:strand:+ start:37003 stop:37896 length:894 start_codon:yes stop_codon:yes gene_type:complete